MPREKRLLWGYIDKSGNCIIEPQFDGAADFHDGLAAVKIDWMRGYIDRDGKFVIEPQYQSASDFCGGVALVELDGQKKYIDKSGNAVPAPAEVEETGNPDSGIQLRPVLIDGKFGYANEAGEVVIAPKFCDAEPFSEGLARVRQILGGKWGFINEKGTYAFKTKFKQAGDFHEGLARVLLETYAE